MIRRVKMKLSENTVNVLKNFSNINQNILVKEGDTLNTMSTMKNIIGRAKVTETFDTQFGIYDLNEFLGVLSLSKDADLAFEDSFVKVKNGRSTVKYFYSDPSILVTIPDGFNPPETDCTFRITQQLLTDVSKACAVLQLPDVVLRNDDDGTTAVMVATDLKNTTSHEYKVSLDPIDFDANFHFKIDNLKVIAGDYNMHIVTEKNVSHWVHDNGVVEYWIALEATSGQ